MKSKLLLAVLLIGAALTTKAQDFELESADPEAMSKIRMGGVNLFFLNLEATQDIDDGSEFVVEYAWGDDDDFEEVRDEIDLEDDYDEGDEYAYGFGIEVDEDLGDDGDEIELTLVLKLEDDTIPENDTIRLKYILSEDGAHRDLQVSIVEPGMNQVWNIGIPQQVNIEILNVGEADFERGSELYFQFLNGNQAITAPQVQEYSGADLENGDSEQLSFSLTLPETFPVGPINLCVIMQWVEVDGQLITIRENFSLDNGSCVPLNIEPNSIDENFASLNNIFYRDGQIVLELANDTKTDEYEVMVHDLTGRQIASTQIQTGYGATQRHEINVDALKPGIYMVSFMANGAFVGSEKLMVR